MTSSADISITGNEPGIVSDLAVGRAFRKGSKRKKRVSQGLNRKQFYRSQLYLNEVDVFKKPEKEVNLPDPNVQITLSLWALLYVDEEYGALWSMHSNKSISESRKNAPLDLVRLLDFA